MALLVLLTVPALLATMACATAVAAPPRQVAITIDDLPRGGDGGPTDRASVQAMARQLLQPFSAGHLPVIGFVNARRNVESPQALRKELDQWLDAGADLGNHTATHPDINSIPLAAYERDLLDGEPVLRETLAAHGKTLKYFRHPYLHAGATAEIKQGLQSFLDAHGYAVAPVTIDDADYAFAALYTKPEFRDRVRREYLPYMESVVAFYEHRSMQVFGREIPQILLIHANQLNADSMPALLDMFRRRGYQFISLAQALQDPAYASPEPYVGTNGISWIHRWSLAKGIAEQFEPDAPDWVMKGFDALR